MFFTMSLISAQVLFANFVCCSTVIEEQKWKLDVPQWNPALLFWIIFTGNSFFVLVFNKNSRKVSRFSIHFLVRGWVGGCWRHLVNKYTHKCMSASGPVHLSFWWSFSFNSKSWRAPELFLIALLVQKGEKTLCGMRKAIGCIWFVYICVCLFSFFSFKCKSSIWEISVLGGRQQSAKTSLTADAALDLALCI